MAVLCSFQLNAWLGGQSYFMPRTHKNQIKPNQAAHSPGGGRQRDLHSAVPPTDLSSNAQHSQALDTACCHARHCGLRRSPRGPASYMAILQLEPLRCACVWCSDGREREVEQLGHYEQRDGTRDSVDRNSLFVRSW